MATSRASVREVVLLSSELAVEAGLATAGNTALKLWYSSSGGFWEF